MDAIASSVVIVLAFVGTFLAIDASTRTATRDIRKTAAYDVAQTELDRLRDIGDTNLPNLLAADNTSSSKVIDGITYSISDRAYYVQGIGTDTTNACGFTSAAAGNSSAQYIYIKVTVTWPGANGASGSTGDVVQPATLDTYFAPEGGDLQTNTGTLRVFLTRINGTALTGRSVGLFKMPENTQVGSYLYTGSTGCVLFTGLARSNYEIRIPSTTEYDLYMTTNPITVPVRVPARATLSRTIKIDYPVTVSPTFVTKTTSGGSDITLTPGASGTNSFVGKWVASASEINAASGTDFISTGYGFMPHSVSAIANKMFPQTTGYSAFAGPCDINDPGSSNRVTIPAVGDTTWAPNGTYTGAFTLRLPNFRIQLNASTSNATANTGMILVRLTDKPSGTGAPAPNCGQNTGYLNTWVRLPGRVDSSGWLTAQAYALPIGKYDVCVRQTGTTGWSPTTKYYYTAGQNNNSFPNPTTLTIDVKTSGNSGTTDCSSSTGDWTSP